MARDVLQAALAALTDVRVLSWGNLKPGAFGGFTTPGDDADFDKYYEALTINANWCCSGGHWSTGEDEIPNWLPRADFCLLICVQYWTVSCTVLMNYSSLL